MHRVRRFAAALLLGVGRCRAVASAAVRLEAGRRRSPPRGARSSKARERQAGRARRRRRSRPRHLRPARRRDALRRRARRAARARSGVGARHARRRRASCRAWRASSCRRRPARPRTGPPTARASSSRCASAPASRSGTPTRAGWRRPRTLYGVPPEIVVGIVGVETIYGRQMGNFRVIDALATLAFDFPTGRKDRSAFFRDELESCFVLCQREGIDPLALKGSYAGAIGMPQFMPTSINRYAVDFDGDGRVDLHAQRRRRDRQRRALPRRVRLAARPADALRRRSRRSTPPSAPRCSRPTSCRASRAAELRRARRRAARRRRARTTACSRWSSCRTATPRRATSPARRTSTRSRATTGRATTRWR